MLLDNDRNHIAFCEDCFYLDGVVATTDKEEIDFYDVVLEKMKLAHWEGATRSPPSPCYHYPEAILKAFVQITGSEREEQTISIGI